MTTGKPSHNTRGMTSRSHSVVADTLTDALGQFERVRLPCRRASTSLLLAWHFARLDRSPIIQAFDPRRRVRQGVLFGHGLLSVGRRREAAGGNERPVHTRVGRRRAGAAKAPIAKHRAKDEANYRDADHTTEVELGDAREK